MPRRAQAIVAETYAHLNRLERSHQGWGPDTQSAVKHAVADVLQNRIADVARRGGADRRNGSYSRRLLTGVGEIELEVPRTRGYSARTVLQKYARRTREVDRMILAAFVLGLSTRKVGEVLLMLLGERVSPSTVSQVAKTLDAAVAAFHQRPLTNRYRALLLDGVVLSRKTGAGALKRPVLVALGILPDNRREVIDYRLAVAESEVQWRHFLDSLYKRGLTGEGIEIAAVDGGTGLLAALPEVYPHIPVQRCWAHKMRNVTDKVRKADRAAVKRSLQRIYLAETRTKARRAARAFARRWEPDYPRAVRCLRNDLDDLLTHFKFKSEDWRRWTRTTNAIERRFREVRRRTRPMGVFSDRTSMDRILYAIFTHENKNQRIPTLFLLTQNS
jgi:putative transposase